MEPLHSICVGLCRLTFLGVMMRFLMRFIAFAICFLCASECFGEQVFWGVEYWQENVQSNGKPSKLFIIKVDLQAKGVRPFVTPELNGSLMNTSKFVSTYGVQVGINTAFFDMGGSNKAIGYFASDGVPYSNHIANDKSAMVDMPNAYCMEWYKIFYVFFFYVWMCLWNAIFRS